jgi:hypothetical protein
VKAQWFASQQKKRKSRSKIKIMLIVSFYIRGVVHHKFVPQGQTVNGVFSVEVLKRLCECATCTTCIVGRKELDPASRQCILALGAYCA